MSEPSENQKSPFSLNDEGMVLYQPVPNSPLPGTPVAVLKKGDGMLSPSFSMTENDHIPENEQEKIALWLKNHIGTVLEKLVALEKRDDMKEPVAAIAEALYGALGIVPRADLEGHIEKLESEDRYALRQKDIRLGPILVFMPELNKPAAVHLRALLWNLWNEKPLPAAVPQDGLTSQKVDPAQADPDFYRAISYPLYGSRVIRVDMLDRVINAVYEDAEKGRFQARHEMAEWLGCPIADLYEVLEAMGHKKVYDPAPEQEQTEQEEKTEGASVKQESGEAPKEEPEDPEQKGQQAGQPEEKPQEKPELATFALRRGKAYGGETEKRRPAAKKPVKQKKAGKDKKEKKGKPSQPRVISTGPEKKAEDSPFAVLRELKSRSGDKG